MNWTTHQVTNQVPELCDYNLYDIDSALREAVLREGAQTFDATLVQYGAQLGQRDTIELGQLANSIKPELQTFDRLGNRVDRVCFDNSWHRLLALAFEHGMNAGAWCEPGPGAQVGRAATFLLHGQIEAGSLCPITMTSASIPVLQREAWFDSISSRLCSRRYDPRDIPVSGKHGMMMGMGMTEKQGGSDLRSNTTQAFALNQGGRGQPYRLVGHKWFYSSPVSDAHLVLARHEDAFSCFYVPRFRADGEHNGIVIQRLKNKMGNVSNASAEVEFQDAHGIVVGELGRGIATLVEMATYTRLDCILGSAALLRQALVQAVHHARHRRAFGKLLINHDLMRCVLADLALESEAATVLALRLARVLEPDQQLLDRAWARILIPAAKFWICKRTSQALAECMEVWGGNGYIEDGPMPRLYREAPVNSIWEGSGNVMCLDVLRALDHEPDLAQLFCDDLNHNCAGDQRLQRRANLLMAVLKGPKSALPSQARYIAREFVLLCQAVLLLRHAPSWMTDAFIQTRIDAKGPGGFGTDMSACATDRIVARAWPA